MRITGCLILAVISFSVLADDIAEVPLVASCQLEGSVLSNQGATEQSVRQFDLNFLTMPPLRNDLQSLNDAELACLYVAGWRDRAIYGDNFASEKLCFSRIQSGEESVFACQVVGHKGEAGRYVFDNMDCENGELDRLSLNDRGLIISSDFASSRQFESHTNDFFLGSGNCQLIK